MRVKGEVMRGFCVAKDFAPGVPASRARERRAGETVDSGQWAVDGGQSLSSGGRAPAKP